METKRFKRKYEIVKENTDAKELILAKAYYPFYLIRKFIYAAILTIPYKYPIYQLYAIIFIAVFPVYHSLYQVDAMLFTAGQTLQYSKA